MSRYVDDLDAAGLEADAFQTAMQDSLKASRQRDPHRALERVQHRRESRQDVLNAALRAVDAGKAPPRRFAAGDTLDIVGQAQFLRDIDPESYARLMKTPRAPAPPKPKPGVIIGDAGDRLIVGDAGDRIIGSESGERKVRSDAADRVVQADIGDRLVGIIPKSPPADRWNGVPGAPNGLVDAMSMVSLLEMWRGRPTKEVEAAIEKLTKQDRYSKGAMDAGVPFFKPDPNEVKRIINSEWRIDLKYAGHDFALPQSGRRPQLDSSQSAILDAVIAIASRAAAQDRYSTSSFDTKEAFGVARIPGSLTLPPGPGALGLGLAKANWALGIHGDRKSFLDVFTGVVSPDRDAWVHDQLRFIGDITAPSQRDRMGEHRTPFRVSLAPARTMRAIREALAEAPEMAIFLDPDGQISAMPKVSDNDPLYDRALFTPQWEERKRELYEDATSKYPYATTLSGIIESAHYFDRYTSRVESIVYRAVLKDEDGSLKLNTLHDTEVDHVVALKYAWTHGFRELYLGALGDPVRQKKLFRLMSEFGQARGRFPNELAITRTDINQLKSDKGPDQFLPFPVAQDLTQHLGNLRYVMMHREIVRDLRRAAADDLGVVDPNFMPTSRAERLAMERVLRGWDVGSGSIGSRALSAARDFYLESFWAPDLSRDAGYLETRESLALMWFHAWVQATTWRYSIDNAVYLLARPVVQSAFKKAWSLLPGAAPYHMPEMYREMLSSEPVKPSGIRTWLYEAKRQNTITEVFDKSSGALYRRAKNRILVPTIRQAFRYSRGDLNAFGPAPSGEMHRPESWRLTHGAEFEEFFGDYVRHFRSTGDLSMLPARVADRYRSGLAAYQLEEFRSPFRVRQASPVRVPLLDRVPVSSFDAELLRSLRSRAQERFASRFVQMSHATSGRIALEATPFLEELWRHAKMGRAIGGAAGLRHAATAIPKTILFESGIKVVDITAKALWHGRAAAEAVVNYAVSSPAILAVEAFYSKLAGISGQMTYNTPSMGRTTLLGHDLRRPWEMRFTGGLDRLEAIRASHKEALTAARAEERALRERGRKLRAQWERAQRISDPERAALALERAQTIAHPADFTRRSLAEVDRGIESRLREFSELDHQLASLRRELKDASTRAKRAKRAVDAFRDLPEPLREGLKATGLKRFLLDVQVSNPHLTMFAGRALYAPFSAVRNAKASSKFFLYGARLKLANAASSSKPLVRFGARGLSGIGHGLNLYAAFESASRAREAYSLLERPGGYDSGLNDEERMQLAAYAEQGPVDLAFDLGLPLLTGDVGGSAVGAFNLYSRGGVRRSLLEGSSVYRSQIARSALSGGPTPSDAAAYQSQIQLLRSMGYMEATGDAFVDSLNLTRFRDIRAAVDAAMIQALRKADAARTSKQSSSAAKHARKIWKNARWALGFTESTYGGGDVADSVLAYRDSVSNPFQGPRSRWAPEAYPVRASVPHRLWESPRTAAVYDSAMAVSRLRDISVVDIRALNDRRVQLNRKDFVGAIDEGTRRLIDGAPTESSPGLRGFNTRWVNRGTARDRIQMILRARQDSIMADTRRSLDARRYSADSLVMASGFQGVRPIQRATIQADPLVAGVRPMVEWLGSRLRELNGWERKQLQIDTLQAAQRLGK